jgi:DNA-binding NtrC family response regulator
MHAIPDEEHVADRGRRSGASPKIDFGSACLTDAPVLLTGAADVAESVARDIHESSGWRHGPFVIVDCSNRDRELDALLTRLLSDDVSVPEGASPAARPSQSGVVFLRDVAKLSSSAQARVADWLAQVRLSGKLGPRLRVIANSITPLIPRSLGGTFNDCLYYRLNVIHIQVEAPHEQDQTAPRVNA